VPSVTPARRLNRTKQGTDRCHSTTNSLPRRLGALLATLLAGSGLPAWWPPFVLHRSPSPWGDGDRPIWKWTNGVRSQFSVVSFGLGSPDLFLGKKKLCSWLESPSEGYSVLGRTRAQAHRNLTEIGARGVYILLC
jgi:hypothetical protein